MATLNQDQIKKIMVGATFLGGGGGGPLDLGLEILTKMAGTKFSVNLMSLEKVAPGYGAMVASLGSPVKIKENSNFGPDAVAAYAAFKKAMKLENKEVTYLYSGEMGGFNTMVPILVAILANKDKKTPELVLLDVDANGRAVPELNTSLNAARGFAPTPIGLGSLKGDKCIVYGTSDTSSEEICRAMCQIYNSQIGFSTWAMSCNELYENSVVGCVSKALEVGEALAAAELAGDEPIVHLGKCFTDCKLLTHGKIVNKTEEIVQGFDVGVTTVEDETSKEQFKIYYQNENLFVKNGRDEVIITAPELTSMVCRDPVGCKNHYLPMDNSTTEIGMMVDVFLTAADEKWWATDKKAYTCWKPALARAGYTGDPIRFSK